MKGQKKNYYIINQDTEEFVCKGEGGTGWAFTNDKQKAVRFVYSKAEKMEIAAKFNAVMIHKDNVGDWRKDKPKSKAFHEFLKRVEG